jgi:hypothetical protein
MRITIYSAMADHPEYRIGQMDTPGMVGPEWSGDVNLNGQTSDSVLEHIFRLFNRVSDEDASRLAKWDYKLPSLSVGDIVTMEGNHYLVCGMGFKKVGSETVRKIKDNPSEAWLIASKLGRS